MYLRKFLYTLEAVYQLHLSQVTELMLTFHEPTTLQREMFDEFSLYFLFHNICAFYRFSYELWSNLVIEMSRTVLVWKTIKYVISNVLNPTTELTQYVVRAKMVTLFFTKSQYNYKSEVMLTILRKVGAVVAAFFWGTNLSTLVYKRSILKSQNNLLFSQTILSLINTINK